MEPTHQDKTTQEPPLHRGQEVDQPERIQLKRDVGAMAPQDQLQALQPDRPLQLKGDGKEGKAWHGDIDLLEKLALAFADAGQGSVSEHLDTFHDWARTSTRFGVIGRVAGYWKGALGLSQDDNAQTLKDKVRAFRSPSVKRLYRKYGLREESVYFTPAMSVADLEKRVQRVLTRPVVLTIEVNPERGKMSASEVSALVKKYDASCAAGLHVRWDVTKKVTPAPKPAEEKEEPSLTRLPASSKSALRKIAASIRAAQTLKVLAPIAGLLTKIGSAPAVTDVAADIISAAMPGPSLKEILDGAGSGSEHKITTIALGQHLKHDGKEQELADFWWGILKWIEDGKVNQIKAWAKRYI